MTTYACIGAVTGEPITLNGRTILHEDKDEMSFLFPLNRIVQYKASSNEHVMALRDHPDLAAVTFPLDKTEFRSR